MTALIHNPSSVDMTSAKIAVPHGKFDVRILEGSEFKLANATVTCSQDHVENGQDFESCFMNVEV